MKEAAGEANITVITIVLIGVVAAVGAIVIPKLLDSMALKSSCQTYRNGTTTKKESGAYYCYYRNDAGEETRVRMGKCQDAGEHKGEWLPKADQMCTNYDPS